MKLRHFYLLAVVAATLGCPATFLEAQSTRVRPDTDRAVTSLTNLNRPRQNDSPPLGVVKAGINDSIDLDVAAQLEQENPEITNPNQGPTSRRAAVQNMVSPLSTRFSQSRDSQTLTASTASSHPSSFGGQPAVPHNPFTPTSSYLPLHVSDRRRPSKATRTSGTPGFQSNRIGSISLSPDLEKLYDVQPHDGSSQMETLSSVTGTASIQAEPQGFLEKLQNPFAGLLKVSFGGFNGKLDVERPCGSACSLKLTGQIESFGSETRGSEEQYSHGSKGKDLERLGKDIERSGKDLERSPY